MELIYKNKKDICSIYKRIQDTENLLNMENIEIPEKSLIIKGENFLALSFLLNKYRNKVDLIYIDPPFNTSLEFFVSDNRSNSISNGGKNKKSAYNDKMNREEYFEFIRERLYIMKELLSEAGSIYFHIDYKVGHYIKIIMDEVFGEMNFKNDITRIKSNPKNFFRSAYGNEKDLILFYSKNKNKNIWNEIKVPLTKEEITKKFLKIDKKGRAYNTIPLHAPGETKNGTTGMKWRNMEPPLGRHWRTNPEDFDRMDFEGQIEWSSTGNPRIKKYADEHVGKKIQDVWIFKDPQEPSYPTEKNEKMLLQIIAQSSLPNSIVLDCFAGSGATLKAAQKLNRMFIGIDSSEVSIERIKDSILRDYFYFEFCENSIIINAQ